jgi:hypothetical protein
MCVAGRLGGQHSNLAPEDKLCGAATTTKGKPLRLKKKRKGKTKIREKHTRALKQIARGRKVRHGVILPLRREGSETCRRKSWCSGLGATGTAAGIQATDGSKTLTDAMGADEK